MRMCGIAGWVDFGRDLTQERPTLQAMTDTLANRGVDDQGLWVRGNAGLGHTRTSIIDLVGGAQPLNVEEDGRPVAVIVYNGEVYNFKQLRTELQARGQRFRTRSDTEVVLRSYLEWGPDFAKRLEGIFAFAIWDLRREEIVLVRDRLGVKPLFYTRLPEGVLFGSEPKALLANPLVRPVVTVEGLQELFATAKKPGQAVFHDMRELRPGHTLTIGRKGAVDQTYWAIEARPHTEDLVPRELVADVPLCTALSGGVDSSTVTAIAAGWRRSRSRCWSPLRRTALYTAARPPRARAARGPRCAGAPRSPSTSGPQRPCGRLSACGRAAARACHGRPPVRAFWPWRTALAVLRQ